MTDANGLLLTQAARRLASPPHAPIEEVDQVGCNRENPKGENPQPHIDGKRQYQSRGERDPEPVFAKVLRHYGAMIRQGPPVGKRASRPRVYGLANEVRRGVDGRR